MFGIYFYNYLMVSISKTKPYRLIMLLSQFLVLPLPFCHIINSNEEGTLTDSHGRKVDFRNVLVIMTSNMGAEIISELPTQYLGSEPEVRNTTYI